MTDEEFLTTLRATFPTLDRWRDVVAKGVAPARGSDLEADDQKWLYTPASSLAMVGLASCREHLHAARLLVEARELFPSAAATMCRSALIGGSLTVWMLEPDDHNERRRRSLSLALEDYHRHIQFGQDALRTLGAAQVHPSAAEQLDRLELRRNQLNSILETLGRPHRINLTQTVVPTAIEVAIDDPDLRAQMALRWRSMSGAAHALLWHYFGNAGTTVADLDAAGIGQVTVAGDVERLIMDYFTAYRVGLTGWRLLGQRSGRPDLLDP